VIPPLAFAANDALGVAAIAAVVLLLVAAAVRVARRRRGAAPRPPARPPPGPAAAPPPPPSPAPPPPAPRPNAPPAPPPALDEEARKEAYRRKKEQERLDKERRREEREAAEQRAREEAARAAAEAEAARAAEQAAQRQKAQAEAGKTLSAGLEKTRGGFMARLNGLLGGGRAIDEAVLADLEELLFTADIGVSTATALLEAVRARVRARALSDPAQLKLALRAEVARILSLDGAAAALPPFAPAEQRPWVVMVVGVNGSGKTTTIGKLAAQLKGAGHSVLLGAGDTFRAAAGEQLEVWAGRVGAPVVRGKEGADPASVCFEAVQQGVAGGVDVVICDTAGRLHTKAPLMEELKKVKRVIAKAAPGAPHEVLLVLDSTNGQNAIQQARQFHEALQVTGLALTKLDGTAKGGVIIGICDQLKLPVRWVGVGEAVPDLRAFSADEFVEALFE
jgi:fused signal recognition particle receptor